MSAITIDETTSQRLQNKINDFFDENEEIEIISVNYQAFQTNNYADHIYSVLIIYK
jgi:UDP-N-acetylglucosamine:LPS N-acetylglucosamine transferase